MLDQRRRRWAGVVQMLYKCFVFARYRRDKEVDFSEGIFNYKFENK